MMEPPEMFSTTVPRNQVSYMVHHRRVELCNGLCATSDVLP
jgi:hypothetical protein